VVVIGQPWILPCLEKDVGSFFSLIRSGGVWLSGVSEYKKNSLAREVLEHLY
jgi:hypothetical protein